jgi:vancomycin resistance protein YoaR
MTGLLASSLAYLVYPACTGSQLDYSSIRVAGTRVQSSEEAGAVAGATLARVLARPVNLRLGSASNAADGVLLTLTLEQLGGRADTARVATLASHAARRSGAFLPLRLAFERAAGRASHVEVPVALALDEDVALAAFTALKEQHDQAPLSARIDLDHHQVIAEQQGRYLDVNGALDGLRARMDALALDSPSGGLEDARPLELELPVQWFEPRISSAFVRNLDITTVLSEYETHFSRAGEQSRRGSNIDVAAAKLDGLVLSPGELVSFNTVVGERSEQNGFKKSWEIFKGEMVEGVGGGTCQVASTLHAASFFGGLDILERLPHSRPSAYIPMGLDSTVVYPAVDLKLRNPHPFPVVVHAKTTGNTLKVEVLGRERPATVHFGRDVIQTIAYSRKLLEEPWLLGKKVIHKQHGIRGYRIRRIRELTYKDGTKRVESTTDYYPPTTDIFQVPVGFDATLLPSLPAEVETDERAAGDQAGLTREPATAGVAAVAAPLVPAPSPPPLVGTAGAGVAGALEIVEGKGAHAPTQMQTEPSKTMRVSR